MGSRDLGKSCCLFTSASANAIAIPR
jgi:hypothetical protein